jgi:hypothetical protein
MTDTSAGLTRIYSDWGPVYLCNKADALLADLRGKLEGECNESAMLRRELEAERAKVRELHRCWGEANQALIDIDDYAVRRWGETKDKCWDAVAEMAYCATTAPEMLDAALPASVDAKGDAK